MDDQTANDLDALTAEPDRLDGHTIDELADYLDSGRTPVDESIESSPACRRALTALERLRAIAPDLLGDADAVDDADDAWMTSLMGRIAADAHAGADFTIDLGADGDETVMTEGTLRAIIRAAGDDEPGVLVGRVRFTGDLAAAGGEAVTIAVDVVVVHGVVIPEAVERLRSTILERVRRHTRIHRARIDITVRDLLEQER